jgi:exopolysaccharide biosynthesis polyprenyl glycosylphosphotransferase
MNKRATVQFWAEFFTSFICLLSANILSYFLLHNIVHRLIDYPSDSWVNYWVILILSYLVITIGFQKNLDLNERNRKKEFISVCKNSILIYLLISTLLLLTKNEIIDSRYFFLTGFITTTIFLLVGKYFLKRWLTNNFTQSKSASITGIITTSDIAQTFIEGINDDWSMRISGIVLLDEIYEVKSIAGASKNASYIKAGTSKTLPKSICNIPVVSTETNFMDWIRSAPLDEVFINLPYEKETNVQLLVEELEDMGITVHLNIPTLHKMLDESKFDNISCKVYAGYPMATFSAATYNNTLMIFKRFLDIIVGLLGTICSIPIILITAIPLLIESPGPLIFKQQRVGKNGRLFNIYKLRSMYADAEQRKAELAKQNKMDGLMFKVDDDPRITKVGKFIRKYSIDELPQFFNVLKGDMSLIGTRPPTVDEFEQYESRHKRRLSMRPGITGMLHVSGRSDISDFEEVVKLDCEYIDNWSPMLDLKILFKTIIVVLTHKGAE